jgi:hypothetical protein
MDEVELVKAVGDVWDDAGEIIESMHALRKRIEALYADATGDEELADVYQLMQAQVDLVLTALRTTLARIEKKVRASTSTHSTVGSNENDGPQGSTVS